MDSDPQLGRSKLDGYPKGRITIPCTDVIWTQSAVALHKVVATAPLGTDAFFDWHSFPTVEKRNYLVERFLEDSELQWLLMIDSDMIPPSDLVVRLLDAASFPGRDVVAALCFSRHGFPYRAAAGYWDDSDENKIHWLPTDEFDGSVREVDWVGTGCVLIWRRVLERMKSRRGQRIFRGIDYNGRPTGRGEDQEFSEFARELGFRLHCDTSTIVGHLGLTNVDLDFVGRVDQEAQESSRSDAHGKVR